MIFKCKVPHCNNPGNHTGYCKTHDKAIGGYKKKHHKLYGSRWQRERELYLARHPLCAVCEQQGRITAAQEMDHIIPHNGDVTLFWNRSNWQGLCVPCHYDKTATENRDKYRKEATPRDANRGPRAGGG